MRRGRILDVCGEKKMVKIYTTAWETELIKYIYKSYIVKTILFEI